MITADPGRIRAVVFDWRGTLVTELTPEGWVREALRRIGLDDGDRAVAAVLGSVRAAAGRPNRLQSPTGNTSYAAHRQTYYSVFADAGLGDELSDSLFDVDSDPAYNRIAIDTADTFGTLIQNGCKIGILSNIHFDIRPAFAAAGLLDSIDAFVLSGETGVQKPDPAIFRLALDRLGVRAEHALMVGDRPARDGVAVEVGMPTLLVPQLIDPGQRRLHLVTRLVGGELSRPSTSAGS